MKRSLASADTWARLTIGIIGSITPVQLQSFRMSCTPMRQIWRRHTLWECEHEVDFAGTAVHRCAVDRIHPVLLYLAERLQRDWERTPCRFPKRTLLGVVLIFPVLAVSDHISGEVQQMKRLCKDCLHCKSKQTGVVTFRYWCEITKVGVRPWMEKPHPKCPLKSGRAGRFES